MAQSVNITELNLPQLEMLKNQLDQEVEFLSTSIAQLKVVQTKYVEAKDCLNVLNKSNEGKELLVPLTSSVSFRQELLSCFLLSFPLGNKRGEGNFDYSTVPHDFENTPLIIHTSLLLFEDINVIWR
nr:prefoldin subunit 5 [Loxodonta africana]